MFVHVGLESMGSKETQIKSKFILGHSILWLYSQGPHNKRALLNNVMRGVFFCPKTSCISHCLCILCTLDLRILLFKCLCIKPRSIFWYSAISWTPRITLLPDISHAFKSNYTFSLTPLVWNSAWAHVRSIHLPTWRWRCTHIFPTFSSSIVLSACVVGHLDSFSIR